MATATARKARKNGVRPTRAYDIEHGLGLPDKAWVGSLRRAKAQEVRSGSRGFMFAFAARDPKQIKKLVASHLNKWQMQTCLASDSEIQMFQGSQGPLWIIRPPVTTKFHLVSSAGLEKSGFARIRDGFGACVPQFLSYKLEKIIIELHGLSTDEERAAVLGLEIGSYTFQDAKKPAASRRKLPQLLLKAASEQLSNLEIQRAADLGLAMNIARHLTNLPGGDLNPRTYAEAVSQLFAGSKSINVEIWEGEKLREERMNLLMAVGAAASEGPRLVRLSYRPKKLANSEARPVAIIGKGITFDSGGLDIKPSSGMRLMRKDMGGSAAAVGIAKWAELSELPMPLDIYLAIAENSVSSTSFRPGDILTARSGMTVEISNTDAEGRLVLADAIDVAVTQEGADKPQAIIDIATLTGAIKVGIGAELAGLFSNSDELGRLLFEAGSARGDLMWRMPLFQPYRSMLRSTFADCMNCSEGSFGGPITAALFLESFVRGVPWAHLDIYAWRDSAMGAWNEAGGNGQPIQALAEALGRMATESQAQELA